MASWFPRLLACLTIEIPILIAVVTQRSNPMVEFELCAAWLSTSPAQNLFLSLVVSVISFLFFKCVLVLRGGGQINSAVFRKTSEAKQNGRQSGPPKISLRSPLVLCSVINKMIALVSVSEFLFFYPEIIYIISVHLIPLWTANAAGHALKKNGVQTLELYTPEKFEKIV